MKQIFAFFAIALLVPWLAHATGYNLAPQPDPNEWVKPKLVITAKNVAAFVNGSGRPSLSIAPLSNRLAGKVGLWVGNGSDGWFRNLKITPGSK